MLNRPDMTICRSDPCCRPAGPARARRAGPPKARARREERRTRRRRRRLDLIRLNSATHCRCSVSSAGDARQASANMSATSKRGSRLADAMPQSRTAAYACALGGRLGMMARRRWDAYLFGTRRAGWEAILVVRLVDEGL